MQTNSAFARKQDVWEHTATYKQINSYPKVYFADFQEAQVACFPCYKYIIPYWSVPTG